jgi:membrane-associated phospholipid phosphatase
VAGIGLTAAVATGWLRVAADQHWATDVIGGAVVGTAAGYGIATAALRPLDGSSRSVRLTPSPGGFTVRF